jgi:hypothetical protein
MRSTACNQASAEGKMTEIQASPILMFSAITLFLILAILEIDLHRDELGALGFFVGEGVTPSL